LTEAGQISSQEREEGEGEEEEEDEEEKSHHHINGANDQRPLFLSLDLM
jgi:hypothetical protein